MELSHKTCLKISLTVRQFVGAAIGVQNLECFHCGGPVAVLCTGEKKQNDWSLIRTGGNGGGTRAA